MPHNATTTPTIALTTSATKAAPVGKLATEAADAAAVEEGMDEPDELAPV